MKRINPEQWSLIDAQKDHACKSGLLRLMCTSEALVLVTDADGIEVPASHGRTHKIRRSEAFTFKVVTDGEVYMYDPQPAVFEPVGEVYTNADRMPLESGTMLEVTKALRQHALETRGQLAEMRRLSASMAAARAAQAKPEPKPEPEPEPAPEPEPEAEADTE